MCIRDSLGAVEHRPIARRRGGRRSERLGVDRAAGRPGGDRRVDAGHFEADVAHVGRTDGERGILDAGDRAAESGGVQRIAGPQGGIVQQLGVCLLYTSRCV